MATSRQAVLAAQRLEKRDDGIRLYWDGDESSFFPYFWLRSACHCETCGDSRTGQRRLHPSDVPPDILPRALAADADNLKITWPDGHRSEYDYDWLHEFACDDPERRWRPRLWNATLALAEVSHDYDQLGAGDTAYLDFLRTLRDYGVAVVHGEKPRGIEAMAGLVGEIADAAYNSIFDLKPDPSAHTFGNTTSPVPPHTDESYLHTPTGILVLYCIQPASDGGESVMVDGFQIATRLRERNPAAFDVLARVPQANYRVVPAEGLDYRTRARALNLDERGELVGFRFHPRSMAPIDVPGELGKALHAANHALCELMLREENQLCFQLRAGDAVFFDNHRVMHSRKGFGDLRRHLQICNVSRERFHQKLRLTARAQGFVDEARQVLPAGVSG